MSFFLSKWHNWLCFFTSANLFNPAKCNKQHNFKMRYSPTHSLTSRQIVAASPRVSNGNLSRNSSAVWNENFASCYFMDTFFRVEKHFKYSRTAREWMSRDLKISSIIDGFLLLPIWLWKIKRNVMKGQRFFVRTDGFP